MIVGILGFIGSGKGTAGQLFEEMGFESVSFANNLKDVASVMFDWPRNLLEGDTEKSRQWREQPDEFWSKELGYKISPRKALQLLGTESVRNIFHKDFWILSLKKKMQYGKNYVITDCRFPNEMEFIHQQGGILIEIIRGIKPHWYNIAAEANRGSASAVRWLEQNGIHSSETSWVGGNIDHSITNDSTKEELKLKLYRCLTKSFGPSIIHEHNEGVIL
jgi:hypothetical protein